MKTGAFLKALFRGGETFLISGQVTFGQGYISHDKGWYYTYPLLNSMFLLSVILSLTFFGINCDLSFLFGSGHSLALYLLFVIPWSPFHKYNFFKLLYFM